MYFINYSCLDFLSRDKGVELEDVDELFKNYYGNSKNINRYVQIAENREENRQDNQEGFENLELDDLDDLDYEIPFTERQ